MTSNWFIKEEKEYLLEENCRNEDLIWFDYEVSKLKWKLNTIQNGSILWFIWDFWTWKTTLLNQVKKSYDWKWIDFDAWKYPNREYLWENFILEFAWQIDKKKLDYAIKKIDWTQNDDKKALFKMLLDLPWKLGEYIPWRKSLKKWVEYFLNSPPAKRNFEIQNILLKLIKCIDNKDICIVIEDIDRSWDAWLYFLETLHYFFKANDIKKNIKVIVPISTECYEYNKKSYYKCIDYEYIFSLENIDLSNFVKTLFKEDIADYQKNQIQSFLEAAFKYFPTQMTLRILKFILRNANKNNISLHNEGKDVIDPRLNIMFQTANNLIKDKDCWSFLNRTRENKNDIPKESIFGAILNCIIQKINFNSIYDENSNFGSKRLKAPPSVKFKVEDFSYKNKKFEDPILYETSQEAGERGENYYSIPSYYIDII